MQHILVINTAVTSFNGITTVLMNYVRNTHQEISYDFVLCGRVEAVFADELKNYGSTIYVPPMSRIKRPFQYAKWLKKLLIKNRYDAIHVHGNSGTMYFEIHAAKKVNIPLRIVHSHSISCKYMLAHKILKPALNKELTDAIACSDLSGQWLFNRDYTVLKNGIDMEKFRFSNEIRAEYRKKLKLENRFVIGHVGYMDTEKNQIFLLKLLKEIISKNKSIILLLIGDGKLRPELEKYIADNQLNNNVLLLGKRADIAELYQCMDLFLFPSLYEGFGIVLVEAQASGLPCIASTGVPIDTNVSETVKYIPLHEEKMWGESILNTTPFGDAERMKESDQNCLLIKRKNYDLSTNIHILKSIYKEKTK